MISQDSAQPPERLSAHAQVYPPDDSLPGDLPLLTVLEPASQRRRLPLVAAEVTIGRATTNQIVLSHPDVSRWHARLRRVGARFVLDDLDSTNGTFVNDTRLTGSHVLRHNDQVQIADVVLMYSDPTATNVRRALTSIQIDVARAEVRVRNQRVELAPKEYRLLLLLHGADGRLCSKDEIATAVWPELGGQIADYSIENLVRRLREKIEPDPDRPVHLLTVKKQGYRLEQSPPTA